MVYGDFPLSLPGLLWIVCTACSFFTFRCNIDIGIFGISAWIVTMCGFMYIAGKMVEMMIFRIVF